MRMGSEQWLHRPSSPPSAAGRLCWTLALALAGCAAEVEDDANVSASSSALTLQDHINACNADPRVQQGLVSLEVCVGADLFFREPFDGNGRTCGSCHPAANNYTIDPTFIASLPTTDALFVAEQVPALAQLERPTLMHQFGLILENVDGLSAPTTRFAMRSVPHCLSLSTSIAPSPGDGTTTPPNQRTGWSGDGAPNNGELRDFQTGAIIQHYTKSLNRTNGTDFRLATDPELDDIRAFVGSIGRSNELDLTTIALTDAGAESGRTLFLAPTSRCNGCHHNAGADIANGTNRNFNTGVENARIAALDMSGIPHDGGFGGGDQTSFNFDSNGDSILDSFGNGTFNTPPLIEAADTGPFFHTNAFQTIEDAIGFYTSSAFANSPAGGGAAIPLDATGIANLGRFLRVLNAAFNCQIAIARVNALLPIIDADKNKDKSRGMQQQLAALALAEVDDASAVLSAVSGLNSAVQTQLSAAHASLVQVTGDSSPTQRQRDAQSALSSLTNANAGLTTTPSALSFSMGQGTLMF